MRLRTIIIGAACALIALPVAAQPFRYMDKAGNILFVEKLSDVPDEYRTQLIVPTPTPVMTKELMKETKRVQEENARIQREQEKKEKIKEQERAEAARKAAKKEEADRLRNDESRDMRIIGQR